MRMGDRVKLLDSTGAPLSIHGRQSFASGPVSVNTLTVKETETTVEILWQDGTVESCRSVDLIPYLNTDEYDCW